MKYLIALSVVLMIISASLEYSAGTGRFGDSNSKKDQAFSLTFSTYPTNINLFNINNINATKRCETYSNLTIKASGADPECLQHLRRSCLW